MEEIIKQIEALKVPSQVRGAILANIRLDQAIDILRKQTSSEGKTKEEILKRIDELINTPFVTARFGNNWKEHARENYDLDTIIDIAWKQGRKAILLERAMEEYAQSRTQPEGVCEWKMLHNDKFTAKAGCDNEFHKITFEFKYCPFCGKLIKRV